MFVSTSLTSHNTSCGGHFDIWITCRLVWHLLDKLELALTDNKSTALFLDVSRCKYGRYFLSVADEGFIINVCISIKEDRDDVFSFQTVTICKRWLAKIWRLVKCGRPFNLYSSLWRQKKFISLETILVTIATYLLE